MLAILGFSVLFTAALLRAWAVLHLLHHHRVDEYLSNPRARRWYVLSLAAPFGVAGSLVFLSSLAWIWWIMLPAYAIAAWIVAKTIWIVRMRVSGGYREFYRRAQWS